MKETDIIFNEDMKSIAEAEFICWDLLRNKTVLITGATGLIGTSVIYSLDYVNQVKGLNTRVIALVRDKEKAQERFESILSNGMISFLVGTVEKLPTIQSEVDYIIHAASQTASKEFVQHAVETIHTSVLGTLNLLKYGKERAIKGFVYLSSMEVYGYPERGHKVKEDEIGALSPLDLRNSYPISKILSESACCAYAREYDMPVKICRLTQTFGPGVHYDDNRIFAYLGRCLKEKKDIILKTKGETERCYLYTADAVAAILIVLLIGESGKAYNIANEKTYCSISEMANRLAKMGGISVQYDIQDNKKNGFPETLYMDLDTESILALGWKPLKDYSIEEMFQRMVLGFI